MENKIVCFAGHKGSGKNTCCNYVVGSWLSALGIVKGGYCVDGRGRLFVTDIHGDKRGEGILDIMRKDEIMLRFLEEQVHPYIKVYSFADELKAFCINVLGLNWEQCYGTDEQKNSPTHIRWEDMPGVSSHDDFVIWSEHKCLYPQNEEEFKSLTGNIIHKPGFMSGREVLQYFGTNIVRKMYNDAWVNATLNKIQREKPLIALICDGRFPNEVEGSKNRGAKTVYLTRQPYKDEHDSETALDNYDKSNFDFVLDNAKTKIQEINETLTEVLNGWEVMPDVKVRG